MSVGVATPTIPVANDVILGEFKAYANYGLSTQLLLGSTRGGAKLEIDRKINEIKIDGAYGYQLDSAGIPLVRYESLIATLTLEQLFLKYFNRKIISDCESTGLWESKDWAGTGGTYTAETTIVAAGYQSAKMTADTTVHGIHEVFAASKNLALFDNSEVSTTSDYIGFSIYLASQDLTDLGTAVLRITFHGDIEGTLTNYYYYDVTVAMLTAGYWNDFEILKSAFTGAGSPNWNAIKGVSMSVVGSLSAEVIAYIDDICLIQAQTNSSIVPVNGGGFDYTDQTSYREFTQSLEILESDYYENITLVGQRHDGKMLKIVLGQCLNDGKLELALEEKDEVVNSTQFTSHYKKTAGTTPPIEIYEYV